MNGLREERIGEVLLLAIERPEVGNALTPSLMEAIGDAVLATDAAAVVIASAGERHFCTGIDIRAFADADAAGRNLAADPYGGARRSLFEIVAEADVPTIAAVQGMAFGAGFELVLACDIAVAGTAATFACPEAKRGMGAQFAGIMLPRRIAPVLAMDMLLTGDRIDAAEAHRRGLVAAVVDDPRAAAIAKAEAIARNAPLSVRRIRRTARRSREMPLAAALRLDEHPNPYLSEDRVEGLRAFVERREPIWKGR